MGSFVDLMGDTVFTDSQITRRTESMVRQQFNAERETILNRKAVGATLGQYTLTTAEQAELAEFQTAAEAARAEGEAARADNALLSAAIAYERATVRLQRYRLADGRPERLEGYHAAEEADATHARLNDGTIEPLPYTGDGTVSEYVIWLPYREGIDPLPLEIEQVQEDGSIAMVPNPPVVQDDAERATAQAVIDNTTDAAVLDLIGQRGRV